MDRHQANVPDNVSQSFRARLVYDAARWVKRIFFVSIRTFFLMSQGDRRTQDRPGKTFFGEEGARGGRSFCPQKGAFPSPAGKHGCRRMRRSSPAFLQA